MEDLPKLLQAAESSAVEERRLRAYFANMIRGIDAGHVALLACRSRFEIALKRLGSVHSVEWSHFYGEFMQGLDSLGEESHYHRPQLLDCDIEQPAVTFQRGDDAAMQAWMGRPASPIELVTAVSEGRTFPGATVGRPGTPVWVTPLSQVDVLLDRARKGPDPTLANAARNLMATSHWVTADEVFAFVTSCTICDLRFDSKDKNGCISAISPVGTTVIEAKGHRHFRHWPRVGDAPDTYGRTYDLDPASRRQVRPAHTFGVREATRTAIPMAMIAKCIHVGRLEIDSMLAEPDEDYLDEVGASPSALSLLTELTNRLVE